MLTLIDDLPETVLGVEATGEVTAEDYETVLVPAVEAAIRAADGGKIRILYVFGHDFPSYSAGAAWQDTKLGLGHLRSWERIAIVGDADWLRRAIHALGWTMPGEIRMFGAGEVEAARAWLTA
jgi:hypothetical protein